MIEPILVLTDEEPQEVTKEELKEVLERNDGDLERFSDYKDVEAIWGYLVKCTDFHKYALMDMDKVILFCEENGDVYSYEPTGDYYPEHKNNKKVVGVMDENAEITPC